MLPSYLEKKDNAEMLRRLFALGASGVEEANKAFEKNRLLALSAVGIFDYEMRHGEMTIETPDVDQYLDYIETAFDLCFPDSAKLNGGYYHRRGLEERMRQLAADKEAKAS